MCCGCRSSSNHQVAPLASSTQSSHSSQMADEAVGVALETISSVSGQSSALTESSSRDFETWLNNIRAARDLDDEVSLQSSTNGDKRVSWATSCEASSSAETDSGESNSSQSSGPPPEYKVVNRFHHTFPVIGTGAAELPPPYPDNETV